MILFLFGGGRGFWKGFGILAGAGFICQGVYKHPDENHEEMN
jgi:hypothetical protein